MFQLFSSDCMSSHLVHVPDQNFSKDTRAPWTTLCMSNALLTPGTSCCSLCAFWPPEWHLESEQVQVLQVLRASCQALMIPLDAHRVSHSGQPD